MNGPDLLLGEIGYFYMRENCTASIQSFCLRAPTPPYLLISSKILDDGEVLPCAASRIPAVRPDATSGFFSVSMVFNSDFNLS